MREHEYVTVLSRTGHYNYARPDQESVSTHIAIMNSDGTKKMCCNITTQYEVDDPGVQNLASHIRWFLKGIIYSTDQDNIKAILEYLIANEDDLWLGGLQRSLRIATEKRDALNKTIADLERSLTGHGWFEQGAWVEP
jgi:hypothetical protein